MIVAVNVVHKTLTDNVGCLMNTYFRLWVLKFGFGVLAKEKQVLEREGERMGS